MSQIVSFRSMMNWRWTKKTEHTASRRFQFTVGFAVYLHFTINFPISNWLTGCEMIVQETRVISSIFNPLMIHVFIWRWFLFSTLKVMRQLCLSKEEKKTLHLNRVSTDGTLNILLNKLRVRVRWFKEISCINLKKKWMGTRVSIEHGIWNFQISNQLCVYNQSEWRWFKL